MCNLLANSDVIGKNQSNPVLGFSMESARKTSVWGHCVGSTRLPPERRDAFAVTVVCTVERHTLPQPLRLEEQQTAQVIPPCSGYFLTLKVLCQRVSTIQSEQGPTMPSLMPGISHRFAFMLAYPRGFPHLRSKVTFSAKLNQKHCPQLAVVITFLSELDLVNLYDGQRITHAFFFSFHSHNHAEGVMTDCPHAQKRKPVLRPNISAVDSRFLNPH